MTNDEDGPRIDQVVFRWANRQGTGAGIDAVAQSFAERDAREMARQLAPILRVSGGEPRTSIVRLRWKGRPVLLRRSPGKDAPGRDSTVCRALVGQPPLAGVRGTLTAGLCLALGASAWGSDDESDQAAESVGVLAHPQLEEYAKLPKLQLAAAVPRFVPAVESLVAQLLRTPDGRVSALTSELTDSAEELAGRPPDPALVALYGLCEVFGDWLGKEDGWSYASYDTVDSHRLRVMFVPRWRPSHEEDARLHRIGLDDPGEDRAARLARGLVRHYLENRDTGSGRYERPLDRLRRTPAGSLEEEERYAAVERSLYGHASTAGGRQQYAAALPAPVATSPGVSANPAPVTPVSAPTVSAPAAPVNQAPAHSPAPQPAAPQPEVPPRAVPPRTAESYPYPAEVSAPAGTEEYEHRYRESQPPAWEPPPQLPGRAGHHAALPTAPPFDPWAHPTDAPPAPPTPPPAPAPDPDRGREQPPRPDPREQPYVPPKPPRPPATVEPAWYLDRGEAAELDATVRGLAPIALETQRRHVKGPDFFLEPPPPLRKRRKRLLRQQLEPREVKQLLSELTTGFAEDYPRAQFEQAMRERLERLSDHSLLTVLDVRRLPYAALNMLLETVIAMQRSDEEVIGLSARLVELRFLIAPLPRDADESLREEHDKRTIRVAVFLFRWLAEPLAQHHHTEVGPFLRSLAASRDPVHTEILKSLLIYAAPNQLPHLPEKVWQAIAQGLHERPETGGGGRGGGGGPAAEFG